MHGHNLQEKAGAYFTEMWLFFVVLLLQFSEELPLKFVDVFYVAEDRLQLKLSKHVGVFAALTDVALQRTSKQTVYTDRRHGNSFNSDQRVSLCS